MSFTNYNLLKQIKQKYGDYHLKPEEHRLIIEALNELAGTDEDPPNTVDGLHTYQNRSGHIIERLSSPCDGSTIELLSGTYTVEEVTGRFATNTTWRPVTGATLSYLPPPGTKFVEYEFNFTMARGDSGHDTGILHFLFNIDGDYPTYSKRDVRHTYSIMLNYKWIIPIGGTANPDTGRQASWDTPKTIGMYCRSYSGSHDQDLHMTRYWNGSSSYQFCMPNITITAVG